jgi:hypothetical protein
LQSALLRLEDWDPKETFAPLSEMIPERQYLPEDIPFGIGKELVVDVPVDGRGLGDVFIDDTLTQVVDLPGSDNVLRGERAILLAVHILARPLLPQEPIPREAMAALLKLLTEAGMQETKTMLGWFLVPKLQDISDKLT